jgi:hypothetical protein
MQIFERFFLYKLSNREKEVIRQFDVPALQVWDKLSYFRIYQINKYKTNFHLI